MLLCAPPFLVQIGGLFAFASVFIGCCPKAIGELMWVLSRVCI